MVIWKLDITGHLKTGQNCMLFRWWSKYLTILSALQMPFEYWTTIRSEYWTSRSKFFRRFPYSDVQYSDLHCMTRNVTNSSLALWRSSETAERRCSTSSRSSEIRFSRFWRDSSRDSRSWKQSKLNMQGFTEGGAPGARAQAEHLRGAKFGIW